MAYISSPFARKYAVSLRQGVPHSFRVKAAKATGCVSEIYIAGIAMIPL
jgi:hypothetical protein